MTKIIRFFIQDGKLLSSSITDTSGLPADLPAAELPAELDALKDSAVTKAMAYDALAAEYEAGKAAFKEHQAISDGLAKRAEEALAKGDLAALPGIIADAKLFGVAREKAKLEAEAAATLAKAQELAAKAAAL